MNELREFEEMIDALDRPWAPEENDRLRAHLHAARRDPTGRATGELKSAIDGCMRDLSREDLRWVIERSTKRKSGSTAETAVACVAEIATEILVRLLRPQRRQHRRHGRHGRR
jgi:hypothetical protein